MSFDELQGEWQSHDHADGLQRDPNLLLDEVRRKYDALGASLFRRDLVEVIAACVVVAFFSYSGFVRNDWTLFLCAFGGAFVGCFLIVDRWNQRRHRAPSESSLQVCLQADLAQVNHQIWLLKNIFWWYLLPPSIGVIAFLGSIAWKERHASPLRQSILGVFALVCGLAFWGGYKLNQRAVTKTFIPRRDELETLLRNLERD